MAGLPVLMHTINRFAEIATSIILVLPNSQVDFWNDLCQQYHFTPPLTIVKGGDSRFFSVKNALATINATQGDIIAIHDGVRPLVPRHVILNAFSQAAEYGSAIPAIPVTNSIRELDSNRISHAVDRANLVAVQTPQAFDAITLINAYSVDFNPSFTDDASVFEHAGNAIHLIAGETCNIKITHPEDIEIAEILLNRGTTCQYKH